MRSSENNKYVIKKGIVAMLDLLGIGELPSEKCVDLLECRDKIVLSIQDHELRSLVQQLDIYQFGDTILFCMDTKSKSVAAYDNYRILTLFLNHLVTEWLDAGFLIRGAIAYGEYVLSSARTSGNATVIGPAVAEVAAWYEAVDWAGVVVVPSCSELVEGALNGTLKNSVRTDRELSWFPVDYIRFAAPVSERCKYKSPLWCLAWPVELRNTPSKKIRSKREEHIRIITSLEKLRDGLAIADQSKLLKIKAKYDNTIEFVRHCGKELTDILPEISTCKNVE